MSRYFENTQRERLSAGQGPSTSAPSTRSGAKAGLGAYDRKGKGHPLNDQRGEFGREHDKSPIEEVVPAYKPAGPEGKGYGDSGAHKVKASPLQPKQRARFQS